MSEPELLQVFYKARDEYRSNAQKAIASQEYRKASELQWGAVTQQLKAFAATCNVLIQSHREFFEFLRRLAKELEDPTLHQEFIHLNALHRNFYDEVIPPDAFPDYYERSERFIARIQDLAKGPA